MIVICPNDEEYYGLEAQCLHSVPHEINDNCCKEAEYVFDGKVTSREVAQSQDRDYSAMV